MYDATSPDGKLILPGVISVPGATDDDTNWLLNDPKASSRHVDVKADLPAESKLTASFLSNAAGQISYMYGAQVPYSNGMQFVGLPKDNSGFGNHLVTLTVDGSNSQQAHVQTFFTGTASNYPAAATDTAQNGYMTPNWYNYYIQASPWAGVYDAADTFPQFFAYTDYWGPNYTIHIEVGTYSTLTLPVFDINPTVDSVTGETLVRCVGTITTTGLHSFIHAYAHEKGHQNVFKMTDPNTSLPIYSPGVQGQPWSDGPNSTDGDHVLDTWEKLHHLNPNTLNTTDYYDDIEPGDDEVLADVQALQPLLDARDKWMNDWADQGLQYMGGKQLYWYKTQVVDGQILKTPVSNPTFYWKFTPRVAGTPDPKSGITAFQVGSGLGPFGDGTYPIQTLTDLSNQYPSVLTTLP